MVEHEKIRAKMGQIRDALTDLSSLLDLRIEGTEVGLTDDQKGEIDDKIGKKIDEIRKRADELDGLK